MKIQDWIDKQGVMFRLNIDERGGDSQFLTKDWHISDPNNKALGLSVASNDNELISVIKEVGPFKFGRFNIAEGFSPDFLLHAMEKVLAGQVEIRHGLFGRPYLLFQEGKIVATGSVNIMDYLRDVSQFRLMQKVNGYERRR